jgi:predicted CXXCH cytochrome family protein
MKFIRLGLVITAAVLITFGLGGMAMAFHDGGVADCAGCHTMHNSQDGEEITNSPGGHLTKGGDPSSTCLTCHAGYGQRTDDGSGYGSGGDFYWITKTYSWSGHGGPSLGDSHGHNVIAADFDLFADGTLTTAPGGSYPASELSCGSCHDPHGAKGNPLLLYGPEKPEFTAAAPILKSPGRRTVYTSSSGHPVDDNEHTAFGSGMSQWCANCHTDFLLGDQMHPVDEGLGTTIAENYNEYVATDDLTGNQATAYWEFVPFETNQALADLNVNSTVGPTSSSKVMCLSCHRAHASAFPDAGRWDFTATLLVADSHPQAGDTGLGVDDEKNSYSGRKGEFTAEQRSLCNKCHQQD